MEEPTALHCWTSEREDLEHRFGWGSTEYAATWEDSYGGGTCLLPDGHDGPHEFTRDNQITIRLPDNQPKET